MSKKLTDQALQDAASKLGVELAVIRAVDEVESRGEGFLPDGHVKILFERHKFHGFTKGKYDASHPNISNAKAGGYGSTKSQYTRFSKAFELDKEAAMKSASWGRYQIMGFNYAHAGFGSVGSFVDAMKTGEDAQLKAFVNIIREWGLAPELRAHQWASFAQQYNGPKFRSNQYDTKLAAAYARFRERPDPVVAPEPEPEPVPAPKPEEPVKPEVKPEPQKVEPSTSPIETSPVTEQITVQKVVQSLGSKVLAGGTVVMGVLSAVGGAFLGVINNPYAFAVVILGCAALGVYAWNKSKDRQLKLQMDLNAKAASKDHHTVVVKPADSTVAGDGS